MQLDELKQLNEHIFLKMKRKYEAGEFGFPISLGVHFGRGMELYAYQVTLGEDQYKYPFIAMIRTAMNVHRCDWAVVTMDAMLTKFSDQCDEEMRKLNSGLLEKAGLSTRVSVITQFAMTKNGLISGIYAEEKDGKIGPMEHQSDMIQSTGNMMLFDAPNEFIQSLMDHYHDRFVDLSGRMPFETFS